MSFTEVRRSHRRAASLFELMAAMTAASVVMATSAALVHRSFLFESRSRQMLADERTSLQLARQFRADVHEGAAVRCEADEQAASSHEVSASEPVVTIDGTDGRITYRQVGMTLVRLATMASGTVRRDDYTFSQPFAWTASCEGRLVVLQGRCERDTAGGPPHPPRRAVDVAASLPVVTAEGGRP